MHVYLVTTCTNPWQIWPILINDASYFDLAKDCNPYWEVGMAELVQLTAR